MKGDERKMFMKKCLSKDYVLGSGMAAGAASPDSAMPAGASMQQDKMKACAAEAKTKELKGADRKAFMNNCVHG